MFLKDTICALATANGLGAIAIIRLSGEDAFKISNKVFYYKKKERLEKEKSHSIHFGVIKKNKKILDEVLVSIFKAPKSYTGENIIEISCHGSIYIQQQILNLLIEHGARMAKPGEFTLRAFLNGKIDLSQAEGVADLIASESEGAHQTAVQHMRGEFSSEIKFLRDKLIHFASLIELELDFSEEDVEFADRKALITLINELDKKIIPLIDSFSIGNVLKNGISVAIVGEPNVGKSTLLNSILKDDRAIVSEIAGTTRDSIEDEIILDGIKFRFIDTAGIRESTDVIERKGIKKTFDKIKNAHLIILLLDAQNDANILKKQIKKFTQHTKKYSIITVANKQDLLKPNTKKISETIYISAKNNLNINVLIKKIISMTLDSTQHNSSVIVTNSRHFQALRMSQKALLKVKYGINNSIEIDLLAMDIRMALNYLGEITGEITTDDLLDNIFKNFCIGK